jgi:hypothetical protein
MDISLSSLKMQVVRTGGIDVGIILSKANKEGGVTKWMVSVDGGSDDEELISEKMLGRILDTSESDDNSSKSAMVDKTVKQPPAKKTSKEKTKHVAGGASDANRRVNTRAATKMGGTHNELFSGLDATRKAPAKPKKKQGDETVVEVEMRTGTLFIYRGNHPRVEFVRTV